MLVTIIMPCFNAIRWLDEAVSSVLTQDYEAFELLAIDGGSTDGTVAWLRDAGHRDARLKLLSESDNGPADAINKGLRRARGIYVGWLNADDRYADGAIGRAVHRLQKPDRPMLVYGEGIHIDGTGHSLGKYPTKPASVSVREFQNGCFICQPTAFFRRSSIITTGLLNDSLKTAFDFDYWLRMFLSHPARIAYIPEVQAYSRWHEDAISARLRSTVAYEAILILREHLNSAPLHWALSYLRELTQASNVDPVDVANFSKRIAKVVSSEDYVDYSKALNAYAVSHSWAEEAIQRH